MSLVDDFLAKERELFSDPLLGSLAGVTDSGTVILVTESEPPVLESTQNGSDESTADSPPSSKTASPEPKSSPVSTMLEEWKIERAASLQKKDDEESRKVAELRKLAAEQLRNWYAVQDTLVESNKVLNRANELKSLKSEKKNTTTSPDWTAISTVSSTPAVGHGIDTSRMKTAILKMVSADAKGQMAAVTRTAPRKMGLVVAMDLDGGIAKGGKIPWSLRKDMAFFKQITSTTSDKSKRNAVIMGRKCWESIPEKFRPLKGRLNVVVSRTLPEQKSQDLIVSNNFDETLQELSQSEEIESIWNIGGTEIYQLALKKDLIDRLIVTKIDKRYDTDLFLKVDWNSFTENPDSTVNVEEDGTKFSIHFYAPS